MQFAGWPSVAVGTFGGRVAFVDPADDGGGDFRVLVVGAVLIPGAKAATLVTREDLETMNEGAVIVDVAVDQGGKMASGKCLSDSTSFS